MYRHGRIASLARTARTGVIALILVATAGALVVSIVAPPGGALAKESGKRYDVR